MSTAARTTQLISEGAHEPGQPQQRAACRRSRRAARRALGPGIRSTAVQASSTTPSDGGGQRRWAGCPAARRRPPSSGDQRRADRLPERRGERVVAEGGVEPARARGVRDGGLLADDARAGGRCRARRCRAPGRPHRPARSRRHAPDSAIRTEPTSITRRSPNRSVACPDGTASSERDDGEAERSAPQPRGRDVELDRPVGRRRAGGRT